MEHENSEHNTQREADMRAVARPEACDPPIRVPMSKLKPNPDQPRTFFDDLQHKWLTESIIKEGVLQPILVRPVGDNQFMIIAGERRYRAAQAAGLDSIPAVVKVDTEAQPLGDDDLKRLALIENMQRSDLNDFELAVGVTEIVRRELAFASTDQVVKFLRRMHNKTLRAEEAEAAEKTKAMFRALGRHWNSFATTQLNVFALHPELQNQLRLGALDLSKARVLNRVKDDETRNHLMWNTIANGWTRAQLRREINDLLKGRVLERPEEENRVKVATKATEFRKTYVKHRRLLSNDAVTHVDKTLAALEEYVLREAGQVSEGTKAA